jgi:alkylhydroperoxidase family enzyme
MFDPIFTPRERAAMEMASIFTENYKDFTDEHLAHWKEHFSDEEMVELAVFMPCSSLSNCAGTLHTE